MDFKKQNGKWFNRIFQIPKKDKSDKHVKIWGKIHLKVQAFYGKIPLIEYEEEIESDNSQDIPESDLKLELELEFELE